jgi:hypothetical protein
MIRHCVFIRFQAHISAAEKTAIYKGIAALKDHVPGFIAAHVGANSSPETGMDKGYSDGFIIDFADASARDAYLIHPDHRAIGGKIVAAAEGGVGGVLVFDLDVPG